MNVKFHEKLEKTSGKKLQKTAVPKTAVTVKNMHVSHSAKSKI
jgi:hypothetical protein